MFAIVALSGTDRLSTPPPPYSKAVFTLPFVVKISNTLRITSFADTQGCNLPANLTWTTRGQIR